MMWFIRRATGLRAYHLIAFAASIALSLAALAVPFWWLGEQAASAAGLIGVLFVLAAYASMATVVLAVLAVLVGRFTLGRIRRTLRVI